MCRRFLSSNRETSTLAARELSGPHREGDEPKPMTHGVEGSDSAIVAVKRTNEAGRPAEVPVEPRAGAKENAEQNGTPRTPSRQGASHGLDRVRQAVRSAKRGARSMRPTQKISLYITLRIT